MAQMGRYLYGFVREKERVNICGSTMSGSISYVYTLPFKEISAVVSNTDIMEYDPTRKYLMGHQKAMVKIMENYTILPAAFGTVSVSEDEILKTISRNYDRLLEQLEYFKDKMELGLLATWKEEGFKQDIESGEIAELAALIGGRAEEEVMQEKIRLGKLVEAATLAMKDEYVERIYEPLCGLAAMSKLKDKIPIKTVFSAYFLVSKAMSDRFDQKVGELCKPLESKLNFSFTGPWPPYNFTDLRLEPES